MGLDNESCKLYCDDMSAAMQHLSIEKEGENRHARQQRLIKPLSLTLTGSFLNIDRTYEQVQEDYRNAQLNLSKTLSQVFTNSVINGADDSADCL